MKFRLFPAVLILVLMVCSAPRESHAQLGVAAGLNFDRLSDIDAGSRSATFDNATGYHVGVFYDLGLGPPGVRLGAFYRDAGEIEGNFDGIREAFALSMIDVPLDLRFNLTATPVVRPYIIGGPVFSFPRSEDSDIDDDLKNVTVSGNIGVGIALELGGITLFPELRYAIGVSRFMEEGFDIGSVSFEADDVQRLNSVMLRLGVRF